MLFKPLLLLLGANLVLSQLNEDEECQTPDERDGTCILLQNCNLFYSQLVGLTTNAEKRPLLQVIKAHHCGFKGKNSLVCCPSTGEIITSGPVIPETTAAPVTNTGPINPVVDRANVPNQIPDVSNHPKIALLPGNCGDSSDNRIYGGNVTNLYQFPWMALISYNTRFGPRFQCGGSIINNRYVLTAAHCITSLGTQTSLRGVRIGEHDIESEQDCEGPASARYCAEPVQDIRIEEAIPHPGYTRQTLQHDVGLIRLTTPITFNDNALPICLPYTRTLSNYVMEGKNFTVTGWGATENGEGSSVLLRVSLPIVTNEVCGRIHNRSVAAGIGFRQVCAGGVGRMDSCGGDSGGPMQALVTEGNQRKTYQYGIVSFGPIRCGTPGTPAVYTRVPYYLDWILDNIRQ